MTRLFPSDEVHVEGAGAVVADGDESAARAAIAVIWAPANPGAEASGCHVVPSVDVQEAAPSPFRPTATKPGPPATTALIDAPANEGSTVAGVHACASADATRLAISAALVDRADGNLARRARRHPGDNPAEQGSSRRVRSRPGAWPPSTWLRRWWSGWRW